MREEWPIFDGTWPTSTITSDENTHIENRAGVVGHESELVIVEPEFNERWALCWVRMPEEEGAS